MEAEPFSAVSVPVRDNVEALEADDDVFGGNPFLGDGPVGLLVLLPQRVPLAAFLGHGGATMEFLQPHGAGVGDGFRFGMQLDAGFFEQPEIVTAACPMSHTNDPVGGLVHDQLRLQRVALLLVRIIPTLFF